jgi:hypothetical protein
MPQVPEQFAPPPHLEERILLSIQPAPAPRRRRMSPLVPLLAAAVILLTVANVVFILQMLETRQEQQETITRLEERNAALTEIISGVNSHQIQLVTVNAASQEPSATFRWSPVHDMAILQVENLPDLPENQDYQLWLMDDLHSVGLGVFDVDIHGRSTLIIDLPVLVQQYTLVGISPEPTGGSLQPTNDPIIFGEVPAP